MLSGALLLPRPNSGTRGSFYRRRFAKIGIPLIVWFAAHTIWLHLDLPQIDPYSTQWYLDIGLLKNVAAGQASWHLYFLFLIAGLYLATPYVRMVLQSISPREELWLVLGLFALSCTCHIANTLLGQGGLNIATQWLPYVCYFVAGHYIVTHATWRASHFFWLAVFGLAASLTCKYIEMRIFDGNLAVVLGGYSSSYFSIAIAVYSVAMVGWILRFGQTRGFPPAVLKVCRVLAPATFGVFLMQLMVWTLLRETLGLVEIPKNAWQGGQVIVAVGGTSLLLTYAIGLIPIVRTIVDCNTQAVWTSLRSDDEANSDQG
tara:strand:- start:2862 stop:3812 length:951 start_codon:yes stop_codon:yes gene_type:complete